MPNGFIFDDLYANDGEEDVPTINIEKNGDFVVELGGKIYRASRANYQRTCDPESVEQALEALQQPPLAGRSTFVN